MRESYWELKARGMPKLAKFADRAPYISCKVAGLIRKTFPASGWVAPLMFVLVAVASASAGIFVTLASARQSATDVPAGVDPRDTRSLEDFIAVLCTRSYSASFPAEATFLGGNAKAMSRMMTGMAITPTGDVDRDFVHMMVPHHQGAIDMAILELRHGNNVILKRLAQEIIVDQQQEITAMYLAIHEPLPASAPGPTWNDPEGNRR
jgi:hypothetical protein